MTGEHADPRIGSLRLLQNTHLIFRGSNFSLQRQGGILVSILSRIKGFWGSVYIIINTLRKKRLVSAKESVMVDFQVHHYVKNCASL